MSDAAEFVERFQAYWRAPTPRGLETVLAPQTRLVAPLTATTQTREEGIRAFAALFELVGHDERRGPPLGRHRDDGVLIEFTITGRAGGKPISWHAVDRFVVGDGRPRHRTRLLLRLGAAGADAGAPPPFLAGASSVVACAAELHRGPPQVSVARVTKTRTPRPGGVRWTSASDCPMPCQEPAERS